MTVTKYGPEPDVATIGWQDRGGWWTAHRTDAGWHITGRRETTSGRPIRAMTWDEMCIWMDKHDGRDLTLNVRLSLPDLPRLGQHVPGLIGVTRAYEVLDTRR